MVQQLSLFSTIDDSSYELFISTLSVLSGNPPIISNNFNHVCKPNPSYIIEKINAKNQLVEQTRIRMSKPVMWNKLNLCGNLDYKILNNLRNDDLLIDKEYFTNILNSHELDSSWALSISDIPSAGKDRKVSMQSIMETSVIDIGGSNDSMNSFLHELGYVSDYQFIQISACFFFKSNINLKVYKVWELNSDMSTKIITKGGFLVKAYINITKNTDIDAINQGIASLIRIQKELKGYVNLEVPDRKSMDSRLDHLNDI